MSKLLSIVSGTYNRLSYLQDMIGSARASIGVGIDYEFVIVDGGSTDGTIGWCEGQSDIRLIKHGKLLGACKAFNDGAKSAKGKYVIMANDDITFLDESILCALSFMEDNPKIGIGCFYQDRYGYDWHVEYMPAVVDGKQLNHVYGQVCIIPKLLGDKVGWWGGYKTYAGDNEMSCNILELGYDIEPVPCACIHDVTPADELRKANAKPANANAHPDSVAWVKKWTHEDGTIGPIIPNTWITDDRKPKKRILYAPIFEAGWGRYKWGLIDAFKHKGYEVLEHDYYNKPLNRIYDIAAAFRPDVFLLQIHGTSEYFNTNIIRELENIYPKAVFISYNGDCFPENFMNPAYMEMMKLMDKCCFVQTMVEEEYNKAGIDWMYWQIGWEPKNFTLIKTVPSHDVVFLGNSHYSYRNALGKALVGLRDLKINVGLYGNWSAAYKPNGSCLYDFRKGSSLYSKCKIAISDARPGATGFLSNRIYEAGSSYAFILQQKVDRMTELTGLEDGKHLVVFDGLDDMINKIQYYLEPKHDAERVMIASTCGDYMRKHCSYEARVKELLHAIQF